MKVAVVTPYYQEPLEVLERCHRSVAAQTYPCTHIMVADGHPRAAVESWDGVEHFSLPVSHRDYGNTPRSLGSISAFNRGFDAVAYLDADNWYAEDHIESLVDGLRKHPAPVAFSLRQIVLAVGDRFELYPWLEPGESSGAHIDTNCYLITNEAAFLAPIWAMMAPQLAQLGDRLIRRIISDRRWPLTTNGRRTVFYLSKWPQHYQAMQLPVPPDAYAPEASRADEPIDPSVHLARLGFDPLAPSA
jgi:glycosyltransferase involved in cell wall biosynthesis